MQKLISSVIESGHGSTIEHIVFTFAITGVSRTLSHQLVRHRAGVAFDQQSQRYVKFKGQATMLPHSIAEADPALRERYEAQVDGSLELYGDMLEAGLPGEDARFVFPNAARTNLVMTTNLRALIHMSGPAPVHDGPVGDPPAVPARPPRDLRGVARSSARSWRPSACRSATATSSSNRDEHCPIRPHKDNVLGAWAEKEAAAKAAGRDLPQV